MNLINEFNIKKIIFFCINKRIYDLSFFKQNKPKKNNIKI